MIADPTTGRPVRIVDVHQHLSAGEGDPDGPAIENRLALLDRAGLDHAVLLPPSGAQGHGGASMTAMNDHVARAVARAPERFIAGVAHIALSEGPKACRDELERAVTRLGLRGAVWHHRFQGVHLDHPMMPDLLRQCADLGVPALIHVIASSALESPWRLERLLEKCPGTKVLALDAFSSFDRASEVTLLARRYPNVFCDLGTMPNIAAIPILEFIERVGPTRLLLGTDLYMKPQTWYFPGPVHEILHLDIPLDVKEAVLSGNAHALFNVAAP